MDNDRKTLRHKLPGHLAILLRDLESVTADAGDMLKAGDVTEKEFAAFQALALAAVYPPKNGEPSHRTELLKLAEILDKSLGARAGLLSAMAAAFVAQVGCRADEVELVERVTPDEVAYYFRRRPRDGA